MSLLILMKLNVYDHLQAYQSVLNSMLQQSPWFLRSFTKLYANAPKRHQGLQQRKNTNMLARDEHVMLT